MWAMPSCEDKADDGNANANAAVPVRVASASSVPKNDTCRLVSAEIDQYSHYFFLGTLRIPQGGDLKRQRQMRSDPPTLVAQTIITAYMLHA